MGTLATYVEEGSTPDERGVRVEHVEKMSPSRAAALAPAAAAGEAANVQAAEAGAEAAHDSQQSGAVAARNERTLAPQEIQLAWLQRQQTTCSSTQDAPSAADAALEAEAEVAEAAEARAEISTVYRT